MKQFKIVLLAYIIIYLLVYSLIYLVGFDSEIELVAFNFFYGIFYFIIIRLLYIISERKINNPYSILYITAFFSIISVLAYKFLSIELRNNLFVFSDADASSYNLYGLKYANNLYAITEWRYDDWGVLFVLGLLYKITPSPMMLSVFYILLGTLTVYYLFKLCRFFISSNYCFILCAVFYLSSYLQWYNSSLLKESIMVFLTIYLFYHLYKFIIAGSKYSLTAIAFGLILMLFFRPAVSFIFLFSAFLFYVSNVKSFSLKILFLVISLPIGYYFLSTSVLEESQRYLPYESVNDFFAAKENQNTVRGSVAFTYLTHTISGLLGPIPQFYPKEIVYNNFFASGLLIRLLLSAYALLAMYKIITQKIIILYPVVLFCLIELFSLVFMFEALELRKAMPHIVFNYFLAFWYLFNIEETKLFNKPYWLFHKGYMMTAAITFLLVIFWNFR
jgi:hypothetical protein